MQYWAWSSWHMIIVAALRYMCWAVICGLILTGGAWYGGAAVRAAYRAWQAQRPSRSWRGVHREAVRGIGDIERFLALRSDQRPPVDRDNRSGGAQSR
jgi:hypothetical protein